MPNHRHPSSPLSRGFAVVLSLLLGFSLACGKSNGPKDPLTYYSHYHPAQWINDGTAAHANDHQGQAPAKLNTCLECHSLSRQQAGSGVPGCLTTGCHHQTIPNYVTLHTLKDPNRAVACAICHYPTSLSNPTAKLQAAVTAGKILMGTPSPGASPNCYNASLCHTTAQSGHPKDSSGIILATWKDPAAPGGDHGNAAVFHGAAAKKSLSYCQGCHGTPGTPSFSGGWSTKSCEVCHTTTGASAHPSLSDNYAGLTAGVTPSVWNQSPGDTPYVPSHRTMGDASDPNWQSRAEVAGCATCHNTRAAGAGPLPTAPTCFSGNYTPTGGTTTGCHAGGPVNAPHPLGDIWKNPANAGGGPNVFHGAIAKQNLIYCQTCHGTPGTNKFDGGTAPTACSSCHVTSSAHPSKTDTYTGLSGVTTSTWYQAPSDAPYVPSHRDMGNAATSAWQPRANNAGCALCHNTANSGASPLPAAPTCFSASFTPSGSTTTGCHATGPGAPHPLGAIWISPSASGGGPTVFHGAVAKQDLVFCQSCHGTPGTTKFDGGTATTKCTTCHLATGAGAHPSLLDDYSSLGAGAPAPAVWNPAGSISPYVPSHRTSGKLDTGCAICHKTDAPATVPSSGFNGPLATAPNCWSVTVTPAGGVATSCHANGPSAAPTHPVPFLSGNVTTPLGNGHMTATAATFANECGSCHIVTGTPSNSAPACVACHTAAATNSPIAAGSGTGTCLSCHNNGPSGLPNGPTGTTFPNIAGAHAKHKALAGVTCDTCHNALGTLTTGHYTAANARVTTPVAPGKLAFLTTYQSKTGGAISASTAASPTCSNVRCHGGVTTPVWTGGTINVNTQCLSCHNTSSATAQYNAFSSGQHTRHVGTTGTGGEGLACTNCHNTTSLATNHFTNLATTTFEGTPSATVGGTGTRINAGNYNPSTKSCAPQCHGTETW